MPTSLEYVCDHQIPEVKVFHLKGKTRLFWNIAVLRFSKSMENNYEGNYFLGQVFLEIS